MQMLHLHQSDSGKWSVLELWRKENAHRDSVLKCYFSPDDSRVASCSRDHHKVKHFHCYSFVCCVFISCNRNSLPDVENW